MKLLIAEDDNASRLLLEKTTQKWDFEPVTYEDGNKAWLALNQPEAPYLLLVDWEMPGMSGIELCKVIRQLPNSELFYIVLLTSRTTIDDLVQGLEAGANDFIKKPFLSEELKARLNVGRRMIELQQQRIKSEEDNERLQRELMESRKMESLGQITGSIAHDFNNILGIIMGYTSMTLTRYREEMPEKMLTYLEASLSSSERAKELVAKMLTFSHDDETESESLQAGPIIERAVQSYRSQLPEHIELELLIHENLPDIFFSGHKLTSVLNILLDNSVEAMYREGTIQVKLFMYHAEGDECSNCHRELAGEFVCLEVTDQGSGIDPENLDRIFEPFFTTKEFGKGMGLAMLHGMFRRMDAHTLVEILEPHGTRIKALLPIVAD